MPTKRSLTEVLGRAVSRVQSEMHVCLPGRVERYDHTQQRADVVPLIRDRYADGQVTEPQVITNVPVVFPRCGGASLTMPVVKGDGVMLHFTDASIDEWLSDGGTVTPDDRRRHDLSDCIAVPGLYSFAEESPQDNNEDVRLQYEGNEIRLRPGGLVEVKAGSTVAMGTDAEEVLNLLSETLEAAANSICTTGSFLSQKAQFESIRSRLESIRGTL